jgi:predicted sulfurtransferase
MGNDDDDFDKDRQQGLNGVPNKDKKIEDKEKKEKKKKKKKKKTSKKKEERKEKKLEHKKQPPSGLFSIHQEEEQGEQKDATEGTTSRTVVESSPGDNQESSSTCSSSCDTNRREKKRNKKDKKRKKRKRDEAETCATSTSSAKEQQSHYKKSRNDDDNDSSCKSNTESTRITAIVSDNHDARIVESSALDVVGSPLEEASQQPNTNGITLLLFYQYVEPIWSMEKYQQVLKDMEQLGNSLNLTGRMRVAREGLNCTLTATRRQDMITFCTTLREQVEFQTTEFKLTNDLPEAQRFPQLKVIPVVELVHYGLEREKAPPILEYHGVHLEPKEYHKMIADKDTVMIDVRNHYEAIIGHFEPPHKDAIMLDPMMRKSTEFPIWLDTPETKEKLKGRNVLMYCTGGIRCERATALLKYKMEHDPEIKNLGIQEVYQLQGGIDKASPNVVYILYYVML